ncbi:uncharacterized protein LOC142563264 [Dermacentor variabilis]|uniref:uncharacterized protein LOC142563264 n=1 Tax=Dermacentor variabilis TaxID=34621 RepID=UPI003F5C1988
MGRLLPKLCYWYILFALCQASHKAGPSKDGITSRGAACGPSRAAMVSDSGDPYKAALTAAHEISHALGSPHDGAETSLGCPESDRHLMNPYHQEKRETYSRCSLSAINKFLHKPQAICLFGEVDITKPELGTKLENNPQLRHQRERACEKRISKGQVISHIEGTTPCKFHCSVNNDETKSVEDVFLMTDEDNTPCNNVNSFQVFVDFFEESVRLLKYSKR